MGGVAGPPLRRPHARRVPYGDGTHRPAGLPFLGDQMVTARLIAERGVGLRLAVPSLTGEVVAEARQVEPSPSSGEALGRLLQEPEFATAAKAVGRHLAERWMGMSSEAWAGKQAGVTWAATGVHSRLTLVQLLAQT